MASKHGASIEIHRSRCDTDVPEVRANPMLTDAVVAGEWQVVHQECTRLQDSAKTHLALVLRQMCEEQHAGFQRLISLREAERKQIEALRHNNARRSQYRNEARSF